MPSFRFLRLPFIVFLLINAGYANPSPAELPTHLAAVAANLNNGKMLSTYAEIDGGSGRDKFANVVRSLIASGDFAAIEEAATFYRTRPYPTFLDGTQVLDSFYWGFRPNKLISPEDFESRNNFFRQWEKAYPASPTRPVAEANYLVRYAWQARGNEWSSQVSEQAWTAMGERLAAARRALDSSPASSSCPESGPARLGIILGEDNQIETAESAFEQAVAAYPDYLGSYFAYATHLLPRWGGKKGQLGAWAESEVKSNRSGFGASIYARLAWVSLSYNGDIAELFGNDGFSWARLRPAFDELTTRTPDSTWNRFHFARIAVLAQDKATARRLAEKLPTLAAIHPSQRAELARILRYTAADAADGTATKPSREINLGFHPSSMSLSPDGRTLAVGSNSGLVVLLDATTLKPLASQTFKLSAQAIVFTHGGNEIVVATGTYNENQPGELATLDAQTLTPLKPSLDLPFYVRSMRLHPDGTLYIAGGARTPKLMRVPPDGKAVQLTWLADHNHPLDSIALSPDGKELAVMCNRGINRFELPSATIHIETRQVLKGWVNALEYSPDGRLLAAVTREGNPGMAIWETAKANPLPERESPSLSGNLRCVAWSPDSRWVATGGDDGAISIYDQNAATAPRTFGAHLALVRQLIFTSGGTQLVSLGDDKVLRLWSLQSPAPAP